MPGPNTPYARNQSSVTELPKAMMDMFAAALRGGTVAAFGMPGDIETLGRMGINAMSPNAVNPKSYMPNTDEVSRAFPPLNPLSDLGSLKQHPMEKLGEFAPFPGIGAGASKSAQIIKALRNELKMPELLGEIPGITPAVYKHMLKDAK